MINQLNSNINRFNETIGLKISYVRIINKRQDTKDINFVLKLNALKRFIFLLTTFFLGTTAFGQCNVNLGPDVYRCWNDLNSTALAANISVFTPGGNPYTLTWDNGIGVDANPQVNPIVTTTYTVTMTDGLGCTDTDNITVLVSHPIADAGPNIEICEGVPEQLDGTGSSGNLGILIYNWNKAWKKPFLIFSNY